MKDTRKKKLILALKCAEELRHCYQLIQSVRKPHQAGGISHVKILCINEDGTQLWQSVYDPTKIETHIIEQHRKHFSQAQDSPFTAAPLNI